MTETDNPHTIAIDPAQVPAATSEQLLGRVLAKLCEVETTAAKVVERVEMVLGPVERLLAKLLGAGSSGGPQP